MDVWMNIEVSYLCLLMCEGVIRAYECNEVMFVCCLTSKLHLLSAINCYLGVKLGFIYGCTHGL